MRKLTSHKRDSGKVAEVMGSVVSLFAQSGGYQYWYIKDLNRLVYPPILLNQCKLFKHSGRVIGYVSWAWLNEEAAAGLVSGKRKLQPKDWKSGNDFWIIDMVAPFGGVDLIIKDLKSHFPDQQEVKFMRRNLKTGEKMMRRLGRAELVLENNI